MKIIYLKIKIEIPENLDESEFMSEVNYSFNWDGKEIKTEILETL